MTPPSTPSLPPTSTARRHVRLLSWSKVSPVLSIYMYKCNVAQQPVTILYCFRAQAGGKFMSLHMAAVHW